ncbi:MAG: archaeosortase/exosortase family protein [Opitutaceae bacterium]|nr:archaeosortase/exosortase family protein [Opitutaceae bacterium]
MSHPFRLFLFCAAALTVLHGPTLWIWSQFAWGHDLFSYTLLAPVVTAYLLHLERDRLPKVVSPDWLVAGVLGALAVVSVLLADGLLRPAFPTPAGTQEWLFWRMLAWAASLVGVYAATFGRSGLRACAFPILFLFASVPLSPALEAGLERVLQFASAEAAAAMFFVTGMTLHRSGLIFHLPGITLEVAPECSGIHSTLVLFITSLVGGYLFLKSPWRRFALSAAVLPLGILRNGVRVWTLGTLCVYDDPSWIRSPLHHQGGPLFFGLSLIPFGLLLFFLYRGERKTVSRDSEGKEDMQGKRDKVT